MKRIVFWGLVAPALLRRLAPAWLLESPLALAARHPWLTLAALGAAAAIAGFAVAASGVVPIKASAGHWPITEWLLHFSMRRSITTHALVIEPPPLDDPALVLRGATHYELGCRPCHGSVGGDQPRIPQGMLPPPRNLVARVPMWRSEQLFYIVRHGVKFTGMPGWAETGREDEVWAVVAFLRTLPSLTREEYDRLVRPEPAGENGSSLAAAPPIVAESCARCHGVDGLSRGLAAAPKLAGQREEYLDRALRAYAERRRFSGIMGPIAAALSQDARQTSARYYAALPVMTAGADPAPARGREIASAGLPNRDIPACVECHGPATTAKNPAYPTLAGQYREYLAQQLTLLQRRRRGGSEFVHLMHSFVDRLTPDDIVDVAAYYESLGR